MESKASKAKTGYRTHNCGELRIGDVGKEVSICGWVQKSRDKKGMAFVDVRDRYGVTQAVFSNPLDDTSTEEKKAQKERYEIAAKLGREYVVQITGKVVERAAKSKDKATGDIEIVPSSIKVLNPSKTPPFLIETKTDALEEIRMKFRYLDIRRAPVKNALILRHKLAQVVRNYLSGEGFIEVETPVLMKSTPEGARDFVVPSRMNPGQFYALPQSPQTFKQILMVAGMDRYFQIVKCFRDEELRADRQPEFTQIDCEMSYVTQEDVLNTFESMIRTIFEKMVGHKFDKFERMQYSDAMEHYGIDKPDLRYEMKLKNLTKIVQGKGFKVFDDAELVVGIVAKGAAATYKSKKKIKSLESLAKSQVVGAGGMIWVKYEEGKVSSSVGKFYKDEDLAEWAKFTGAKPGDLLLIFAGPDFKTREAMGKFRHELGTILGLRNKGFYGLWVVDFPLLEYDDEEKRWCAMHHPFTSPKPEDVQYLEKEPGKVRANAYDMVINGVEVGGGSIRIHDQAMQMQMFKLLGFTEQEAKDQFGFLMGAFEYGAPPHGGLAFGFDRLCSILGGEPSIRNFIAFPKNKQGRDLMIEAPSAISQKQLDELCIATTAKPEKPEKKNP
eukprot:CAMPEP_0167787596 /NCGR_PEP_ID=MMETSP0111_2-20121227/9528_1 /TAXON_ID=91324 /ORGANISM="Lotharella globosa, Strain CCCM811" /LENGTH=611 /DNA_ID=CAMNT_0007679291 /DNA_START=59 /DNA_END=1894 /DNA_ORIENTATION=+